MKRHLSFAVGGPHLVALERSTCHALPVIR